MNFSTLGFATVLIAASFSAAQAGDRPIELMFGGIQTTVGDAVEGYTEKQVHHAQALIIEYTTPDRSPGLNQLETAQYCLGRARDSDVTYDTALFPEATTAIFRNAFWDCVEQRGYYYVPPMTLSGVSD